METSSLVVRRVPLGSLHLDPANAREHGPENLEAIVSSLKRFGQAEPIVVQRSTGRVIGGNGRLVAMTQLGWTECDVVELDYSLSSRSTGTPSAGLVDTPALACVFSLIAENLNIFTKAPTTSPTSSSPRNFPGQTRGPYPNPK